MQDKSHACLKKGFQTGIEYGKLPDVLLGGRNAGFPHPAVPLGISRNPLYNPPLSRHDSLGNRMNARYTVFGNPVAHSRSPEIHRHFAGQEGVSIEYTRTLAGPSAEAFSAAVHDFFSRGGSGANVTLPFKQYAYDLADEHSRHALAAGAANTLIPLPGGRIRCDNTDGTGLVKDLTEYHRIPLQGKNILLLGAGGAVRGVIRPMLDEAPQSLTVANRTRTKAEELAGQFGIEALDFSALPHRHYDIIINGTSGSLSGQVPDINPAVFGAAALAYDMVYGSEPTAFMRLAAQSGAGQTADGLGMLVAQAAFSYQLWRGFAPDIRPVIERMKHGRA